MQDETYNNCNTILNNIESINLIEYEEYQNQKKYKSLNILYYNNYNNQNNTLAKFVTEKIFGEIYLETLILVKQNLFIPFCQAGIAQTTIRYAQQEALWFLPNVRRTIIKADGNVEYNQNPKFYLTFKSFFSYPEPCIEGQSQTQYILLTLQLITCCLCDYYVTKLSWPWWYVFPLIGFLSRFLCGPKFSPLDLFNIFFFSPLLIKYFPRCFKYRLLNGKPKRFGQFLGVLLCGNILLFRLLDFYLYNINQLIKYRPFLITCYAFCTLGLLLLINEIITGFCLGVFLYNMLIKFRLVDDLVFMQCEKVFLAKNYGDVDNYNYKSYDNLNEAL
eukprot:Pgem_evm3s20220